MNQKTTRLCVLAIGLLLSACGGAQTDPFADVNTAVTPESATPAFDPASATAQVHGNILFEGEPQEPKTVRVGGSRFCVINKQYVTPQDSLITADGKLENVMVYVRSGFEGRSYPTPQEPAMLDQEHCVYVPHVLTLMTNQKLTVRNSDDTFHNVHANTSENPVVNFAQSQMGVEDTISFASPEGPFRIGCDLHGWMTVWVGVFDHPFHTTSGETGTYELNLPPGKYEIVAWHETYGEHSQTVEVADGSKTELNFTFAAKSTD